LKGNEQETLSTKGKWQTFHRNLRPHRLERYFLCETARAFLSSWRLVCLAASHHGPEFSRFV